MKYDVDLCDDEIPFEEFSLAMKEQHIHTVLADCCELIYDYGLERLLASLSDYCADPKESYALAVLSKFYKENESAFCKDAPTMQ